MKLASALSGSMIRQWLTAAVLYFIAAVAVIHWTSDGRSIAAIWPADAVLLALLISATKPRLATILSAGFVANVLANHVTRGTLLAPALYASSNMVEVAAAFVLLRRAAQEQAILGSLRSGLRFLLVAGIVAPAIGAALGSLTAWLIIGEPIGRTFDTWMMSNSLGLLVFTPVLIAAFRGDFGTCFAGRGWAERGAALMMVAATAAVTSYVFYWATVPMLFAVYPPIMLLTFAVGRLGTKVGVMATALIGGVATATGHGPIAQLAIDAAGQAHLFQLFVAVLLFTCLPVAAEVTERSRLTAELARQDQELVRRATTDPLTGVLNRAAFEEAARTALAKRDGGGFVGVIAIDLDRFKEINDLWGHQVGDMTLCDLSTTLRALVRHGDVIGRMGGDEFVLLLPDCDMATARMIGERVRDGARRSSIQIDQDTRVAITLSLGVVLALPGEGYDAVMRRADEALYAAKRGGRDAMRFAGHLTGSVV